MHYFMLAVLAISLSACAQTAEERQMAMLEKGAIRLSGADLAALFGNELNTEWSNDTASGTATYQTDGTATLDWGDGDDTGTWRIMGDTQCSKWKEVRKGQEKCFEWWSLGDDMYEATSSNVPPVKIKVISG